MSVREIDAEGAPDMDALLGQTIGGRFLITGRIARGGMACVYSATQTQLNRPVAIKVMRSNLAGEDMSEADFRRRFLQEASILSQLQHPNVVTLLDYGQITEIPGDHYYIAMELLQGETLARRFRSRGRLEIAPSLRIARQIGRGLREAHRHGFIHRDLKPSNIMLVPEDDQNDIVKLVDFGIGKAIGSRAQELLEEEGEEMTRVGLLLGSPRYMAPEQIRGEAVEARTDLYGLGIILFQMLTGRLPFECRTQVDTLVAHCSLPPPPLEAYLEEPSGTLSDLVRDLLKKRPTERPTIHEFLLRLAAVEDELFGSVGLAGPTLFGVRPSLPPRDSSILPPPPPVPTDTMPLRPPPPSALPGRLPSPPPRVRTDPPTAVIGGTAAAGTIELGSLPAFNLLDVTSAAEPRAPAASAALPAHSTSPITAKVEEKRKRQWSYALALLVLLGLGWLALRPVPPAPVAVAAPSTPASLGEPAKDEPGAFALRLDSTPTKATVREGETVLGTTPLTVSIERGSVKGGPRHFAIERAGYVPYAHEQPDSKDDVTVSAQLVRLDPNPAAHPRVQAAVPAPVIPPTPPAAPVAQKPSLDINMQR